MDAISDRHGHGMAPLLSHDDTRHGSACTYRLVLLLDGMAGINRHQPNQEQIAVVGRRR
jgi:hypothetical protein